MRPNTFISLTLFLLLNVSVFGRPVPKNHSAKITLTIDFDKGSIQSRGYKQINLKVSQFPSNALISPYKEYDVALDTIKGKSRFQFNTVKPLYFNIAVIQQSDILMNRWDNVYMVQPGDSINCHVIGDQWIFSGNGSTKLNCQSEIFKCITWSTQHEINLLNDKKYAEYFNEEDNRLDSILNAQIAIVNKYKQRLTPEMKNTFLSNCYGLRYYMQLHVIINYSNLNQEAFLAYVKSDSFKKMNRALLTNLDLNGLLQSSVYTDALFEKIAINNMVNKVQQIDKFRTDSVRTRTFNTIMDDYQGKVRQKLLMTYFLNYQYSDTAPYWPDISTNLENSEYHTLFLKLIGPKKKGVPFFPFKLPDTDGNFVELNDLKDKVVILDFWYTGCENCLFLNRAMAPVVGRFKNDPRVVFVSVSIDKNKSLWLKSIASGMYTHDNEINLYTNSAGYHHPLLAYYNITGYPTLFVLKQGTMFAPTPERPALDAQGHTTTDGGTGKFIQIIEEALSN
jgi:thiol-disulfide isomerase/thioredoxin